MEKPLPLPRRIGHAMRQNRQALGINQDDFAASLGMHRTQYSSLERGERNLTLATLDRVCRGLGRKMSDLLRDAGL